MKPTKAIINNSAAHFPTVLKSGMLMHYGLWRLANLENPLSTKSKMANSGSKCKSSVGFQCHSHFSHYRFDRKIREIKNYGLTYSDECPIIPKFGLVWSTPL